MTKESTNNKKKQKKLDLAANLRDNLKRRKQLKNNGKKNQK
ncbi:MAG: hypothetical protein ACO2XZ_04645 [Rickettsiales bacterium]|jgi:hypothetical protein